MAFMKNIKDVVAPAFANQTSRTFLAKVLHTNEKHNTCDILFNDQQGVVCKKKNVQVHISDPKIASYFPKKDDIVYISYKNNIAFITGAYFEQSYERYGNYTTATNQLYFKNYGSDEGNII